LRAAGILGKHGGRDIKLARHPSHESIGWLVEVGERRAWMAQQCKLNGAAETIGVAAPLSHQVSVQPGKGEQPRQRVSVGRDAQERLTLPVGQ
jgi:hypothetical protein